MFKTIAVLVLIVGLVSGRNINSRGLALIKQWEGFRANFYGDVTELRTIGYGHACLGHACNNIHAPITMKKGEELLQLDLVRFQKCVQSYCGFVNDNQFAALVSFVFNLGCNTLKTSTMLKYIKAKNYNAAANQFGRFNHAGGRVVEGLTKRRAAERSLFLS